MTFSNTPLAGSVPPWQELIVGGQKSGKTRRAETLAQQWLQVDPQHQAVYFATGRAADPEMQARIARHQADRSARAPRMRTQEVPLYVAQALRTHSNPQTLVVVDCLTMWLTNWLMPMPGEAAPVADGWRTACDELLQLLPTCPGPVVLVGNEIGMGVIPMGAQVRAFVDALGVLNQQVAQACSQVTLMAAGLPLRLK